MSEAAARRAWTGRASGRFWLLALPTARMPLSFLRCLLRLTGLRNPRPCLRSTPRWSIGQEALGLPHGVPFAVISPQIGPPHPGRALSMTAPSTSVALVSARSGPARGVGECGWPGGAGPGPCSTWNPMSSRVAMPESLAVAPGDRAHAAFSIHASRRSSSGWHGSMNREGAAMAREYLERYGGRGDRHRTCRADTAGPDPIYDYAVAASTATFHVLPLR